jgi:hypothetical protein
MDVGAKVPSQPSVLIIRPEVHVSEAPRPVMTRVQFDWAAEESKG